jgi:site-specific DNA-methyltransferase (adenine-specific)
MDSLVTSTRSFHLHEEPGFAPVPRLQIVTVEQAMRLRERAVQLPARRDDAFKRAAREADSRKQTSFDL